MRDCCCYGLLLLQPRACCFSDGEGPQRDLLLLLSLVVYPSEFEKENSTGTHLEIENRTNLFLKIERAFRSKRKMQRDEIL